jgi:hypothetical protein
MEGVRTYLRHDMVPAGPSPYLGTVYASGGLMVPTRHPPLACPEYWPADLVSNGDATCCTHELDEILPLSGGVSKIED